MAVDRFYISDNSKDFSKAVIFFLISFLFLAKAKVIKQICKHVYIVGSDMYKPCI